MERAVLPEGIEDGTKADAQGAAIAVARNTERNSMMLVVVVWVLSRICARCMICEKALPLYRMAFDLDRVRLRDCFWVLIGGFGSTSVTLP